MSNNKLINASFQTNGVFIITLGDGGVSSSGPESSVLTSCLLFGDVLLLCFCFLLLSRWKRNNLEEALIELLFEESENASASHSCIIKGQTFICKQHLTDIKNVDCSHKWLARTTLNTYRTCWRVSSLRFVQVLTPFQVFFTVSYPWWILDCWKQNTKDSKCWQCSNSFGNHLEISLKQNLSKKWSSYLHPTDKKIT